MNQVWPIAMNFFVTECPSYSFNRPFTAYFNLSAEVDEQLKKLVLNQSRIRPEVSIEFKLLITYHILKEPKCFNVPKE